MKAEQYQGRYPFMGSRQGVWREIARAVAKDAADAETVLELGPGFCDFINQFPARTKLAFDINPDMAQHAADDVEFTVGDAVEIPGVGANTIDLVFASNFLEHLPMPSILRVLARVREILKPGGRLALLQPNFRLCPKNYFDDETHVTVFTDASLAQVLVTEGLRIERLEPGWLPFSMSSRLPKWPGLVRLYLASPIKPNGAQMYLVARKD